jgi:hypothetical protein
MAYPKFAKQGAINVATFSRFSSSNYANILVGALWSAAGELIADSNDTWGLCCERLFDFPAAVMPGEQDITGLAIEAYQIRS